MSRLRFLLYLSLCLSASVSASVSAVKQYTVKVTDKRPQPRENFVQGLEIEEGYLYVSAGNYGESRLLRYHFADDGPAVTQTLNPRVFAEGLTVFGDKIYQLTWQNKVMLVYRKSDLQFLKALPLTGEGWGLTHNEAELIYSDGSEKLYFMAADSAQILRSITVTERGQPVHYLNELEWIDGAIWANIWKSDRIVIINPNSGEVTASIDLRGLLPPSDYRAGTDVLNGIARNPADGAIWVTGKRWPWMYRVELVPVSTAMQTEHGTPNSR